MNLLDLLFPPRCAGCRAYGSAWCRACAAAVEPVGVTEFEGVPLIAAGRFGGPLQQAIHTYKYSGRRELAALLSPPLVGAVRSSGLPLKAVTFVPLHADRLRERGFNQAGRLAEHLAGALSLPLVDGLRRLRPTPAQVGLTQAERAVNLLGAFRWQPLQTLPGGLLVVDDVCTTGATLRAAGDAIRLAGGSVAAFAVLARAQTLAAAPVTLPEQPACS